MLHCHFLYFHSSNFNMAFVKNFQPFAVKWQPIVSKLCVNGYFIDTNQSYISWPLKKLIRPFQYFHYCNTYMIYMINFTWNNLFLQQIFKLSVKLYYIHKCINNAPIKVLEKWKYWKWERVIFKDSFFVNGQFMQRWS